MLVMQGRLLCLIRVESGDNWDSGRDKRVQISPPGPDYRFICFCYPKIYPKDPVKALAEV